jgi:16S rRNA (uracil1498-N3)-methyltransferase
MKVRAPIPDLAPGQRRLEGAVAHYLSRVLRLRAGDAFVAFDPATGRESDGSTVGTDAAGIIVRFGPVRDGARRVERELILVQGMAKGDKCDGVVRDATELGATRVLVAPTRRTVVRLEQSRAAERQARWARVAREAARQCGRSQAPLIDVPCPWDEALGLVPEPASRFCLWERATDPLAPALLQALARGVPLAFACGPEGGLEEAEVQRARDLGWVVVSVGPFTLRTETVAAAVLGAVRVWSALEDAPSAEALLEGGV